MKSPARCRAFYFYRPVVVPPLHSTTYDRRFSLHRPGELKALVVVAIMGSAFSPLKAQSAAPANSALSGMVVDSIGQPVPFAQVSLVDGDNGAVADQNGRFRLSRLAAGQLLISVRRIGFDPLYFDVSMPDSVTVEVKINMHANAREIAAVSVKDVREPLRRIGFYDRMAAGSGHFIPPDVLERMRPLRATDAFMNIPNLVVDRRGNKSRVMGSNYRCEYAVVIDQVSVGEAGSRIRTTSPDDLVSASDLYAIEVYPRNRGLPAQFVGMSHGDGCGTILIWTKGMIAR